MFSKKLIIVRFIPLLLLILAFGFFIYFRLYQYLTFDQLKRHREFLQQWTQQHYITTALTYIMIYILVVAISLPGATILTISGGFLFGIFFGALYAMIAATIGATILFLTVKTALGPWLASKTNHCIQAMEHGFQKNSFNYLLFLRLMPLFPFWVVNIVSALLNMRLIPFIVATFIGIIPGTIVYTALGNGLGTIIAAGKTPDLYLIFNPQIFLPMFGLAILSLLPIFYKKYKRAHR